MTALLRDRGRDEACAVLRRVAPDAPTLCAGWTAHDLAVHLWTLNHDALAWPAVGIPALEPWGRRRAELVKARWSYAELVERLATGPSSFACMPGDRREGYRHALGEWFVHAEDVRRAGGLPVPTYPADLQDALWLRLPVAARALAPVRGTRWRTPDGRARRTGLGPVRTTVTGAPSELLLWLYGRREVADVVVA